MMRVKERKSSQGYPIRSQDYTFWSSRVNWLDDLRLLAIFQFYCILLSLRLISLNVSDIDFGIDIEKFMKITLLVLII